MSDTAIDLTIDISELFRRPRRCAANWLISQARDLILAASREHNSNLLVAGCLEARSAIEQQWFDILCVLRPGEMTRERLEEVRRGRDGVRAAIHNAEPDYGKLVRFSMLCMRLDSFRPVDIIPWDIGRMKKWWHALSAYCHAQLEPRTTLQDSHWFAEGIRLVQEVFDYFEHEMSQGTTGILRVNHMNEAARLVWDDFVASKINEEQAFIRLKIVRPRRP
jgi:hypothetical protein